MRDFRYCTVSYTTLGAYQVASAVSPYDSYYGRYKRSKNKSRGFCLNHTCISDSKGYRIIGHKISKERYATVLKYSTSDANMNDCPSCKHALFWSTKYRKEE